MSWLVPMIKAARSIRHVGIVIFVSLSGLAQSNDYWSLPETAVIINSQRQKPPEQIVMRSRTLHRQIRKVRSPAIPCG
jgi:hypothetical protein